MAPTRILGMTVMLHHTEIDDSDNGKDDDSDDVGDTIYLQATAASSWSHPWSQTA